MLSRERASERGNLSSLPQLLRRRSMEGEVVFGRGGWDGRMMVGGVGGSLRIVSCANPRSIVCERCAGSIGRIAGRAGDFPFSWSDGDSDIG